MNKTETQGVIDALRGMIETFGYSDGSTESVRNPIHGTVRVPVNQALIDVSNEARAAIAICKATLSEAVEPGWIAVSDRLPGTGVLVVVRYPATEHDWTKDDNIVLDYISEDYEDWHNHCEHFEHYMAVGGSGAAGPDCVCVGPSQKAPYTHWTPIPSIEGQTP